MPCRDRCPGRSLQSRRRWRLPAARSCRPAQGRARPAAAAAFDPDKMVDGDVDDARCCRISSRRPVRSPRSNALAQGRSGGGRRQIRQSEEAGEFALDLCGQARRQDRRPPTRSRARQRSTSTSTATARPTLRVQIGPAIRGTALRDTLDFVDFNDFTNQIDFAAVRQGAEHPCRQDRAVEAAARGAGGQAGQGARRLSR